jgi:hypothetical protein
VLPDGGELSTVFLNGVRLAGPLLFETMLFDAPDGEPQLRNPCDVGHYATWDEAAAGHQAILRRLQRPSLREGLPQAGPRLERAGDDVGEARDG